MNLKLKPKRARPRPLFRISVDVNGQWIIERKPTTVSDAMSKIAYQTLHEPAGSPYRWHLTRARAIAAARTFIDECVAARARELKQLRARRTTFIKQYADGA